MAGAGKESDEHLFQSSLGGDHDAFGRIVRRYESLVRSVAFGTTGNAGASEDVAQETFIAAWRSLASLRHPSLLRAWLCAIARHLSRDFVRREGRNVVGEAVALEDVTDLESEAPLLLEEETRKERESILWREMQRIPMLYREAMVLHHREGKPVDVVAETLGITESAVKKRLARGRKLLQARVALLLQDTLAQTRPVRSIVPAVLAALPGAGAQSGAAQTGIGVVSAGGMLKEALTPWLSASLAYPFLCILFVIQGAMANIARTFSTRERRFVFWTTWICVGLASAFHVVHRLLTIDMTDDAPPLTAVRWLLWGYGVVVLLPMVIYATVRQHRIRLEDASQASRPPTSIRLGASSLARALLSSWAVAIGGMSWLLILTALIGEWPTFGLTLAFTVGVCAMATRRIVDARHRYYVATLQTVGLMAAYALTLFSLRWGAWAQGWAEYQEGGLELPIVPFPGYWGFATIVLAFYLFLWQRLEWTRRAEGTKRNR